MVGLIPKTFILDIVDKSCTNPLASHPGFLELCKNENIELVSSNESENLTELIRQYRPEIMLIDERIFRKNLESSEDIYSTKTCQPFKLVMVSSSCPKEDIFQFIKAGADEVMVSDMDDEEVFLKIFSIIRRKEVLDQNRLTNLPSINRTHSVLEHCQRNLGDWALIHFDLLHFQSYSLMYGVAKADNTIRELGKLLVASIEEEVFIGHLGKDNFVIISNTNAIEQIITKLKSNFAKILSRLYKQADYENGYIISSAPNRVRRRESLMSLNFGVCTNIDRSFLSSSDILEQVVKNKKESETKNKKVLILEDDDDFATLLEETLVREGNEALVSKGFEKLVDEVAEHQPRTLILEATKLGHQNFIPLCDSLKKYKNEFGLKILVATNVPGYQNFLDTGADVYLPKPYDIETLLKEVRRLRYAKT